MTRYETPCVEILNMEDDDVILTSLPQANSGKNEMKILASGDGYNDTDKFESY